MSEFKQGDRVVIRPVFSSSEGVKRGTVHSIREVAGNLVVTVLQDGVGAGDFIVQRLIPESEYDFIKSLRGIT